MSPASQRKLCFVAFYLYVTSILTALLLSYVPIDPLLCIGLKVLLLFLTLFFYALHAENNENHVYLDPKALRAAGGPRYLLYFLVARLLPAYCIFCLVLILFTMDVETTYNRSAEENSLFFPPLFDILLGFTRRGGVVLLISRGLDYMLRILRGFGDGDMHAVRALCEEEPIPQKFTYRVMRKLAAAGYIHAVCDVGGDVCLIADLSTLTLFDLLKVFEPGERVNHCTTGGYCYEWIEATQEPYQARAYLADLELRLDRRLKRDSLATVLFGKQ